MPDFLKTGFGITPDPKEVIFECDFELPAAAGGFHKKIKMCYTTRNCDHCGEEYQADNRNLKRGWGLCCSKSCAAKKREMSKPGYDPKRVEFNNQRRATWNGSGRGRGIWSREHKMYVDGFGEPLYLFDTCDDDPGWDAHK